MTLRRVMVGVVLTLLVFSSRGGAHDVDTMTVPTFGPAKIYKGDNTPPQRLCP